ncbi:BamA/TamA family outer membrane protein [Flavobacterium restrictum]|uniref:POTRA domain-containing protein n=1 Tax=Flavobacterium restrictum TaxID=2594428 RepID=A0A553E552_9FLAO|nr:hypothetical protein [Flavobacterium restrictum]TRX40071.1 hypothetical protein FNW21_07635 [Flavobacterium restrictum]
MKSFAILITLFILSLPCNAQNFKLKITGITSTENQIIDSTKYISSLKNIKSVTDEITKTTQQLTKQGYLNNKVIQNTRENDSLFTVIIALGQQLQSSHIYIGINSEANKLLKLVQKSDTLILKYSDTETFLNQTLKETEQKGFAFAKLKLLNIQLKKETLYADLDFNSNEKRALNTIVIKTEKDKKNNFPIGYTKQINRKYKNTLFNQETVRHIHEDFDKFKFVYQIKYPEILFTKDSTKVYVYLEKRKANTFDGYIGFSNKENKKIKLNGYVDINLENILGAGENLSVYWKSDGNNQKTFKTSIEIPYIFKSPLGIKAEINIFKQDSTYQNTKTALNLGYFLDYTSRIYLGYQSNESSDIQNTNSTFLSDYKNSYTTLGINWIKQDNTNLTFPEKSFFNINLGFGKRNTTNTNQNVKQFYLAVNAMHTFYLNQKNSINLKTQNYYLQSQSYLTNELFRFGGINSIRGFAENSLQANLVTSMLTEYRYQVSSNLYLHSIADYCLYKDETNTQNKENFEKILGLGIGFGIQTNNGLLKIALVNGSTKNQEIKFSNTNITICYNVKF